MLTYVRGGGDSYASGSSACRGDLGGVISSAPPSPHLRVRASPSPHRHRRHRHRKHCHLEPQGIDHEIPPIGPPIGPPIRPPIGPPIVPPIGLYGENVSVPQGWCKYFTRKRRDKLMSSGVVLAFERLLARSTFTKRTINNVKAAGECLAQKWFRECWLSSILLTASCGPSNLHFRAEISTATLPADLASRLVSPSIAPNKLQRQTAAQGPAKA